MSSAYTSRQMRFIHMFTHHIQALLKSFLNMEPDALSNPNSISNRLDDVSKNVNAASAVLTAVGVITSAPTLGTSAIGASAAIVLLQTLNGSYQFVKRHADNKDAPLTPDETKLDEIHLTLTILLRRIAYLTAVRYRHFIDEIIEEKSINTFATFFADRAMKTLTAQLDDQLDRISTLKAEDFLDYFMASVKLSALHESAKVNIKAIYSNTGCLSSTTTYAKWAGARAGLAIYDESSPPQYTLYTSAYNIMFPGNDTTMHNKYGFITAPSSELSSTTAAVNRIKLRPLTPAIMDEILNKNKQHFCVYYLVSRQDISDYLIKAKESVHTLQSVQSLNDYLSELMNTNVIAACHDDRLRGLDLSDGNFSETMFDHVDLSECNLRNTVWTHAHLNEARFKNNEMSGAHFQHVFAEKSIWEQVNFSGDFSHAKLNGSKMRNCLITAMFNQFGCEWELVELENVQKENSFQLLKEHFEEQLTREHQERIHLNNEIKAQALLLQRDQLHRWETQIDINKTLFRQMDSADHESLPADLKFRWETDINTPLFQQIKKTYVELNAVSGTDENSSIHLSDRLEQFLQDNNEQFLLVHGDVGAGKTLSVALWHEELMRRFQGAQDWLPVYIRLIDLHDHITNPNFLKAALETVLNKKQIRALMENFRCVIICDALEESEINDLHQILEQCSDLNIFLEKRPA